MMFQIVAGCDYFFKNPLVLNPVRANLASLLYQRRKCLLKQKQAAEGKDALISFINRD